MKKEKKSGKSLTKFKNALKLNKINTLKANHFEKKLIS